MTTLDSVLQTVSLSHSPVFQNVRSLPICRVTDQRVRQVLIGPQGNSASFPNIASMNDMQQRNLITGTTAIDNSALGRIYEAIPQLQNGFLASVTTGEQTANGFFSLCRDEAGVSAPDGSSSHSVYVAALRPLNNFCAQPNPRRPLLGVHFSSQEILSMVRDSGLLNDRTLYCTSEDDPSLLSISPDLLSQGAWEAAGLPGLNLLFPRERFIGELQRWVEGSTLFDADRRRQVIAAMDRTIQREIHGEHQGRQTDPQLDWGKLGFLASVFLGMPTVYMLAQNRGWTKPIDAAFDAFFDRLWKRLGMGTRVDFVRELTADMVRSGGIREAIGRAQDYQAMRDHFHRKIARILTITARAGEGKTRFIEGIAYEAAMSRMPEINMSRSRFYSLSLSALSGNEDSKYVGQLERRWNDFTKQVDEALAKGQEVYVMIDEIHRINGMGATSGGGSNNLGNTIKDWISKMESEPRVRLFGATTAAEYPQLVALANNDSHRAIDEALKRRFPEQRLNSLSPEGLRQILTAVAGEWQKEGIRGLPSTDPRRIHIAPEAIERAIELSSHPSIKIANPDASLTILDMATARAARQTLEGSSNGTVTGDMVNSRFAEEYQIPMEQIRTWRVASQAQQITPTPPLPPSPPPPSPPAAPAVGTHPAASVFTVDHFAAEIGERYGLSQNGIVHTEIAPILNNLARMSFEEWRARGMPVETIALPGRTARIFPEGAIETVVHAYHQGLLERANPNHVLFSQGLSRSRAMRGFGSLPELVRDAALHVGRI